MWRIAARQSFERANGRLRLCVWRTNAIHLWEQFDCVWVTSSLHACIQLCQLTHIISQKGNMCMWEIDIFCVQQINHHRSVNRYISIIFGILIVFVSTSTERSMSRSYAPFFMNSCLSYITSSFNQMNEIWRYLYIIKSNQSRMTAYHTVSNYKIMMIAPIHSEFSFYVPKTS